MNGHAFGHQDALVKGATYHMTVPGDYLQDGENVFVISNATVSSSTVYTTFHSYEIDVKRIRGAVLIFR